MAYSAIILGLVSSLHCMGMCGPIVLSVNNVFGNQSLKSLFYQMGRITTYFILGCLVGVFGELLMLSEVQRIITLVCGFILILVGVNTTLLEYNFIIRKL
ncbi:MAG: sulfite exporter TauE/SafE family protein, partial [Cytophagales bacterium]|nr:sulfite exporter TauE/SafE family protein [Cytophagales bacterium]